MINPRHTQISLSRQCRLLTVSRSSVYYRPRKVKQEDLDLMRLIDEQYLKTPAYGSRSMRTHLCQSALKIDPLSASNFDPPGGKYNGIKVFLDTFPLSWRHCRTYL